MISNKIENNRFEEDLSDTHQSVSSHNDILVKPHVLKNPKRLRETVPSRSEHMSS